MGCRVAEIFLPEKAYMEKTLNSAWREEENKKHSFTVDRLGVHWDRRRDNTIWGCGKDEVVSIIIFAFLDNRFEILIPVHLRSIAYNLFAFSFGFQRSCDHLGRLLVGLMQGQRGAIGSFPATLGFEHGSSSSDANVIDQQICFENNMQNSPSNDPFLNSTNQGQNLSLWNVGEPSSSSSLMKSCPESPSSLLSLCDHNNVTMNLSNSLSMATTSGSSSSSDPFGSSSDHIELEERRLSRKRKAVELGQSSSGIGIGSSDMVPRAESGSITWHGSEATPTSESIIPRLGLSVGGGNENSRRNVLRITSSRQQDSNNSNNGEPDVSGLYPSLRLNPVDFITPPVAVTSDDLSSQSGQQALRIPALRRNVQSTSRWSRNPSSRAIRSSNLVISGDRNEPDSISDHPLFAQLSDTRTALQTELNWSSNGGGGAVSNVGIGVSDSSRASPSSGPIPTSAAPNSIPPRGSPHYHPRRLSAFLRRSLLSASDSEAGGGPNSNLFPRLPPAITTSELGIPIPPVVSSQGQHHQPHSRSSVLLGRQLDGAFGVPYLSRTMTGGSEGRGRLVSEIRNVLDLMRRGEPLRFEDLMILDQSVFYGIADIHDRHRDMRLDIDNMSYEELLALEERIGNVNTGLNEETISKHLKTKQYVAETGQPDAEPCCVCQEEYHNGDDLGTLDCGHDFHHGCIKQWLQHKNSCPICKSTGFAKL
ncbi:unnamed protein product [Lactuca saligna]|uniref:RING-type E3 ubiquitin transferase n=1 Tax=Lactuca saligna TaxID=75948 RepID=A0AA35VPZ5_LACSI|nr:unnamed protein product [Lactuca saligna]